MGVLEGKVAVVLGAAGEGNMGQTIARRLAKEGAKLVVTGRHEGPLKTLADELGGSWFISDITKRADLEGLVAHAVKAHGGCHIAVNAVGRNLTGPILETTEQELDDIIACHLKGGYFFLQTFGKHMSENGGGSLIQLSTATVEAVIEDHAAYIATKAACESLVKTFANQLGRDGVKINVVSPGFTRTPMTAAAGSIPGIEDAFIAKYPMGRFGTSDDIADAIVWLGQDGSFVTGQTLQINGGLTLRGNPTAQEFNASIMAAMQAAGA